MYIYVYTRPNYSGESIDRARTAWGNAALCDAVRAFWLNLASGNRETPYSDADTAPRGSEVPVFTVPFPARFSATRQIPGDPMREFRGTAVFTMLSTPRFGLRWSVALVASLGSFGDPRGLPRHQNSIRAVKPGVSVSRVRQSVIKIHRNDAAVRVLPRP